MLTLNNSMNKKDIIFAVICGLCVAWIAMDFLPRYWLYFFVILPVLSVIGLWMVNLIGKKYLFVKQIGKFVLVGAFADVIDIKIFQGLFIFAQFYIFFKAVSFLFATFVKFWLNKYWAFEKDGKENMHKEAIQFFGVTLVGLIINVGSFYYFVKIMGPQFSTTIAVWTELSIIFSALVSAVWNFLGYKFLVFKK